MTVLTMLRLSPTNHLRTRRSASHELLRLLLSVSLIVSALLLSAISCRAQTKRLVILKVDGLPYDLLDEFVRERDPRTGKSQLPWIENVFYQRGTRLANFYVRGMSLSAPSWSLIETGQQLQIKGNVEFDRYTLHTYDYLNFIPFYFKSAAGARIDMPGAEVLDSLGLPLLFDAFPHEQRYISFQLYQRGMRFATLKSALQNRFARNPRDLFDEWTIGLETRNTFFDEMERELTQKLDDPNVHYLDLYVTGFDHVAHHNRDRESHLFALKELDRLVGRLWIAIQKSSMGPETAFVVVSDHGFNTNEKLYSQGYNLVNLLGSPAGGGHHVVTKRRLLLDYAIKGVYFMVPLITTTTNDSYYLKGQSTEYPTALLDFDGNERSSIHLRDSDLNLLHILLRQLQRGDLSPAIRRAATNTFFNTLDSRRRGWQEDLDELNEELQALRRRIDEQQKLVAALPKKLSREEIVLGHDDDAKRVSAQLERWVSQQRGYTEYARTLAGLLALRKESLNPTKLKIENVIAKEAMGDGNSVFQLQNYIVGTAPSGLAVAPDGSLDLQNSFLRVNYFSLLLGVSVKNNVQPGVSNRPIDMIATRIDSSLVASQLNEGRLSGDAIWVNGGPDKQVLILVRDEPHGGLSFRYQPIRQLRQDAAGRVTFELLPWQDGLPLRLFEDPQLLVSGNDRNAWLNRWHTDQEWLEALYRTQYSNGLVGLSEELGRHALPRLSLDEVGISVDEQLARRLLNRQRKLIETDLLLVANNHWNFDVRGFNPGGNHGSFFRISTHSTFMVAGGDKTPLSQGAVIEEPYDSLSFAPTMLALTGNLQDDNNPIPLLWDKGFRRFPGRVVSEMLSGSHGKQRTTATGVSVPR
ncbi:MAG: alkaline phosphatase family protein [bacterium]